MNRAYLKCEYWKDKNIVLFSNEYVIKFRCYNKSNPVPLTGKFNKISEDEDWCIVDESELIKKINNEKGLVKVLLYSFGDDKAIVGIQDSANHQISKFYVPPVDIQIGKY